MRFLTRMRQFVSEEAAGLRERITALRTYIWAITRMCTHMCLQVPGRIEGFPTRLTIIWSLARMDADMHSQVEGRLADSTTCPTDVMLLILCPMRLCVHHKPAGPFEAFSTRLTDVLPIPLCGGGGRH